jgi:membrane fusion protein (multidrug efflux system)
MQQETENRPSEDSPPKGRFQSSLKRIARDLLPLIVLGVVVFLVILYANDWKFWDGIGPQEVTNDAYVRADVTPLSTKISGTVSRVLINDYDHVKKGQLIVEIRDDDFIARVNQTKSLYDQALSNIASVKKQIEVQKQHIENARLSVSVDQEDVNRTHANVGSTEASLLSATHSTEEARHEKTQAEARLVADEAVELRALQERRRQEALFADNASTQQTIEQVVADHDRAKAIVAADHADINRLSELIKTRNDEIARQRSELNSANAQNAGSRFSVSARAAQLSAEKRQLDVLTEQLKEAKSEAQARKAAWDEAVVELDYTKIRAPVDGTLSERRVRAGQQVNAGTQVITIVYSVPWVIASYRETQTRKIFVGNKAEVSVDALGSAVLKGTVQSMSPASEAQFALLPPDNPSGNFTKITQRVPIKIVFYPDQKNLDRIKPGMTVIAKVWTH